MYSKKGTKLPADNIISGDIKNPKDFLWPNERNIKNYEDLLRLYDRGKFVSFIGAGLSKSLGIKDWKGLLEELSKVAQKTFEFKSDLPANPTEYPSYAEDIYTHLENKGAPEAYFNTISEGMRPTKNTTSLTLVKLAIAINVHLTTNFDRSIEYAYKFLSYLSKKFPNAKIPNGYETHYLPDFGDYLMKDKDLIYYLHGNIRKELYILKKGDYDRYYPSVSGNSQGSRSLEQILEYYYRNRIILFIGFSLGDDYIRQFLLHLAETIRIDNLANSDFVRRSGAAYEHPKIRHFLFIDTNNDFFDQYKTSIFDELQQYNINPIIYKAGKHIFLEYLFDQLG